MPVPTSIADCSATASSNYPSGSESIGTSLDDYLRSHAAIIRQVYDSTFIPSGTKMPFAQSAAPTGWTQDVTDNSDNRMLRVVKTAGSGVGGSHSPILNNVVPSHTHGMTTGTESVGHSHSGNTGNVSSDHAHDMGNHAHVINTPYGPPGGAQWGIGPIYQAGTLNVMNTENGGSGVWTGGTSANHYHGFSTGDRSAAHTHSGTTDNGSSQTNWTPRYIDMIVCSKN